MKKKKNRAGLYIILGLIFIVAFSVILSNLNPIEEIKFNKITYSEYKKLFEKDSLSFVYVGRAGCSYCQQITPLLKQIQEEFNMAFYYLDTDTMSTADFNDIKNTAAAFKGDWGTPTLLSIVNKKELNTVSGYNEIGTLRIFVQDSKNGVVSSKVVVDEITFNTITYSQYKELFKKDELSFVYVGRAGCSYCQQIKPLLKQIENEYNIKFNYLDTDTMSTADFDDIKNTATVFKGEWGTPTLVSIINKKEAYSISGYREIAELRTFVENSNKKVSTNEK